MTSIREYVGVDEAKFSDIVQSAIVAAVIIAIITGIASSIIFGTLIYYNHVDHMADRGYVLVNRRIGSGLTGKDVAEWVKAEEADERRRDEGANGKPDESATEKAD